MKNLMMTVISTTVLSSMAFAEKYESFKLKIDWNDKETLHTSVVHMCDDTFYPDIRIQIPGKPNKDFQIQVAADISSGKPEIACTIKALPGSKSTTYVFDGSDGGCEVLVRELPKNRMQTPKEAAIYIADAC